LINAERGSKPLEISRGHALRNYVIRRVLLMIPTLLGITLVTFLI